MLHDDHKRRQQPSNLHPWQTGVNFFTGRGGDGHDCHILDDCSEKALLFIDVIDENRLIKLRRTHCGKYLEMD